MRHTLFLKEQLRFSRTDYKTVKTMTEVSNICIRDHTIRSKSQHNVILSSSSQAKEIQTAAFQMQVGNKNLKNIHAIPSSEIAYR
jgi:hypothetical protein